MDIDVIKSSLENARDRYYRGEDSGMTDDEYDALKTEVIRAGYVITELPDQNTNDFALMKHARRMNSIGVCIRNRQEFDELTAWPGWSAGKSGDVWMSTKLDGMSCEVVISDKGVVTAAVLRGDGDVGENVIDNVRLCRLHEQSMIRSSPSKLVEATGGGISLFGELVISHNNFAHLNAMRESDGQSPYANPRNAVGLVRAKSTPLLRKMLPLITFVAFDSHPRISPDYGENLTRIREAGFDTVHPKLARMDQVLDLFDALTRNRPRFKYLIDGAVLRTDTDGVAKMKFPPDAGLSTVVDITETLGRTGILAPVVTIEPLKISGVTVRRVSVHNHALINRDLGGLGVGARVLISRRGDVIPHVERVMEASETPWFPRDTCPSCGSKVVVDNSYRRCSSDPTDCPGTLAGLLVKFCRTIGIEGIGPGVATALVVAGTETPADLYLLTEDVLSEIGTATGVIGAGAAAIMASIDDHRSVPWGTLLGALGVEGCAISVMETVALKYPDPDVWPSLTGDDLMAVAGVGPDRAEAILRFIDLRWDELVRPLIELVEVQYPSTAGPLSGKVFCITLALRSCSRPEMEARIRAAGGGVKSSVTRDVTHLVCNDPNADTTKHRRAIDLNIPIIDESVLIDWMGVKIADIEPEDNDPF